MKKENVFVGNLIVDKDSVIDYTEVTGYIDVQASFNLKAPELRTVGGSIHVRENAGFRAPALKIVGGSVYALANSYLKSPALKITGESIHVWENSELETTSLKTVGGYVAVWGKVELPALNTVVGFVNIRANAKVDAPELKTVGIYVYVREKAEMKAPALSTVGWCIEAQANANLETNKEIKLNVPGVEDECRRELMREFEAEGYSFADGILAKIVSRRGNVWRVVVCGETEVSYVVSNGDAYSHGKTLEEARDSLMYKISSRDTSKFKTWTLDRVVSKAEAIEAYRVITGACEAGVRQWMEQHKTPDQTTVKGIIELTKDAYGNKEFAEFFRTGKALTPK